MHVSPKTIEVKPRLQWIDAAKGIGIIIVILIHSEIWNCCKSDDSHSFTYLARFIGTAAIPIMPLFYILSGYTFKNQPSVMRQRLKRLMSPYILWGCVALSIWAITSAKTADCSDFLLRTAGLIYSRYSFLPPEGASTIRLFPNGAEPLWFLTSMVSSYACFLVLIRFFQYRKLVIISYIIMTVLLSFLPVLLPWSLDTAPAGALFLYAGYMMKEQKIFQRPTSWLLLSAIILLPLLAVLIKYNGSINMSIRQYGKHPFLSPCLFLFIGIIGSYLYCLLCITLEKLKIAHTLTYIGRISLTILCSHMLVLSCTGRVVGKIAYTLNIPPPSGQYLFIWQLIIALLFAIILTEVCRLGRSLLQRR